MSGSTGRTTVGQLLTPAGQLTTLGDLPLNEALSPDGRYLIVSNNGQGTQSLQVIKTATGKVVQTIPYKSPESLYMGLAFSPDGTHLFASAAGNHKIRTYHFDCGKLVETSAIQMPIVSPKLTKVNLYRLGSPSRVTANASSWQISSLMPSPSSTWPPTRFRRPTSGTARSG